MTFVPAVDFFGDPNLVKTRERGNHSALTDNMVRFWQIPHDLRCHLKEVRNTFDDGAIFFKIYKRHVLTFQSRRNIPKGLPGH